MLNMDELFTALSEIVFICAYVILNFNAWHVVCCKGQPVVHVTQCTECMSATVSALNCGEN